MFRVLHQRHQNQDLARDFDNHMKPRRLFLWVFDCATEDSEKRDLFLHVRQATYLACRVSQPSPIKDR